MLHMRPLLGYIHAHACHINLCYVSICNQPNEKRSNRLQIISPIRTAMSHTLKPIFLFPLPQQTRIQINLCLERQTSLPLLTVSLCTLKGLRNRNFLMSFLMDRNFNFRIACVFIINIPFLAWKPLFVSV